MSSEDKKSNKKHADSKEEASESDDTIDHLRAIGNDSEHDALEDYDNEALATIQKENASAYMPVTNLPEVGIEGAFFSVTQTCPEDLPLSLSSTSLEGTLPDENGGSRNSHQSASLVSGRSNEDKAPVENFCELSVQSPCPGMMVTLFLLERTHLERHEKWYILFMIPEGKHEVYKAVLESYTGEIASQQGYKTRQMPFAVGNARSQEFHSLYVQEQIKVSFEIQNPWQQNFVTQDAGREYVFRVPNIHCESENRVVPGAKSHFRVEYIGGPGKLCQEQGKIALTVDSTELSTLFFSIAIWVPD